MSGKDSNAEAGSVGGGSSRRLGGLKAFTMTALKASRERKNTSSEAGGDSGSAVNRPRLIKAATLVRNFMKLGKKSTEGSSFDPLTQQYENTYRTEPTESDKFRPSEVEKTVRAIIQNSLKNYKYNNETARSQAAELSDVIMQKVKQLGFKRYKLICNVLIGQNCGQSLGYSSQCLWDSSVDSFAQVIHTADNYYAVVLVHASYYE